MLGEAIISPPLLPAFSSDLVSILSALFSYQEDEPSITKCQLPESLPYGSSTGQASKADAEVHKPKPQPSSPVPSRPSSPMSIDNDGTAQDSPLEEVAEKDAADLSHLGKLHLQDHMSHTVRRIWPDIPQKEDPQPGSYFPSTNPWPTASFTAVKEAWSNPWDSTGPTSFPLPSGRPTPIPTPATIPDRYIFSNPSSRVSQCEPSDLGLVYRRRYLGNVVTLIVGPDNFEFKVHKKILTSASSVFTRMFESNFREASEGKAHLDEDDPNAWSLIVDWLYCGTLPPFKPAWALDMASSLTVKSCTQKMKRIPLPSYPGPPVSTYSPHTSGRSVQIMRLAHLCTQPLYDSVSADELRLVERHMEDGEFAGRYFYYLQSGADFVWDERPRASSQRNDAIAPPCLTEEQHRAMYRHLTMAERIPVPVPFPGFVEAEFLQVTLLKVLILSHKYALNDLFDAAMDAYRRGERELERRHPVIRHLELAYALCPPSCPLITLIADMAAFSAKLNGMAPEVVEFAVGCADFRADLAARHDARVAFPGFDRRRDVVDVFQSPLGGGKDYHLERRAEQCQARCEGEPATKRSR